MSYLPLVPGCQHQTIPMPTIPLWAFTPMMQKGINYLQDGGKIPVELVVNVVLAAVSEACQSHIEIINPYTNMPEPCALYIVTLADSGTGKSTVNKQLRKPFDELKAELDEAFQNKLLAYKRDYAVWETKLQALKSNLRMVVKKGLPTDETEAALAVHTSMEPVKPLVPTLVCNDPSEAALIELFDKYSNITINSDEASSFFVSCVKDNSVFYNKTWDGDLYEHKRGNQASRSFKPTLTLSLMLQRPLFLNFMKKNQDKLLNSGLLARFLFTNIPTKNVMNMGHRHHSNTSFRDETAIPLFHEQIKKLLKKQKQRIISGKTEKKTLKLSPEAAEFWGNKRDIWISLPINDPRWRCIDYMLQKANTNTLRIAGLLHYFSDQETEIIPLSVVQSASLIMDWYLNQAVSWFYQFTDEYKFYQDVEELRQWIHNKFTANGWLPFKKNDIIKYGPNKFRRSDKLEPLMNYIIGQPGTGFFTTFRTSTHSAEYITWRMSNGFYAPLAAPPVQYLPQQAPKLINSSSIA
ncbi:DUF3987 domain-containing protein [Escherichia coli]|uniref:DUF3987 domain-containing protein n=1 Tax=Escherichia coli TaxID=562 RepID=UPI000FC09253|nr:DUF3987 domain-containing protein [Escherichia coli]EFC9832182.1 DUF3987 domain-containing protein [Escherichia coli]EFH6216374.1 DUF3987 domain-containing protein [Escherichia coli]EFH9594874.1 DUF3987 domain-containing protein [Escherichia coli]EHH6281139.1 DUF3987 domain-containing protein [Escherichia coli]EHZ4695410.1 DUF3987 domain-containing protein [Escherichia coli]